MPHPSYQTPQPVASCVHLLQITPIMSSNASTTITLKAPRPGFMWVQMSEDEANEYTKHLIHQVLDEMKPRPIPEAISEAHPPRKMPVPLWEGIKYAHLCVHERFKTNPYGIGAGWFYAVIAASFVFSIGNMVVGTLEAIKIGHGVDAHLAIFKAFLAQLPVVWMLIGFCFPALIANMAEQFRALGVNVHNI